MAEVAEPAAEEAGRLFGPTPLTSIHDLSQFSSGKSALDEWLRNSAFDSEGRTARTYVVCEGKDAVVGYYCISTGSVERRELPSKMKRARGLPNQVPVAIIGRLARDVRYIGKGLGKDLLQDALTRVLAASQIIGVRAILVHALDDEAVRFWKAHEFIECPIDSRTFYLPIETIANAI